MKRVVRVIHKTGNTGGWSRRIEPFELLPNQRVISANYWTASGNHEQLDVVIEEEVEDD